MSRWSSLNQQKVNFVGNILDAVIKVNWKQSNGYSCYPSLISNESQNKTNFYSFFIYTKEKPHKLDKNIRFPTNFKSWWVQKLVFLNKTNGSNFISNHFNAPRNKFQFKMIFIVFEMFDRLLLKNSEKWTVICLLSWNIDDKI